MKRLTVLIGVALVVALSPLGTLSAQTPALPSADQVIEKYVTAMGGQAAFEKLTSRVATGTIELPDFGMNGTMRLTEKAPNKSLVQIELPGMMIREGTDGAIAWDENPQTGLREKSGTELAEARRGSTFNLEIKLKTIYPKMTVTGREQVGTRPVIVVEAVPTEGSPAKLYFDAENGLLLKQSSTRQTEQGPVSFDNFYEDYRTQDGVKQPFTIRQVTAQFSSVIKISEMKHNVAVDDSVFKKPGI
jgi:hypothetical protein